jgi:hypothetical protein
MGSDGRDAAIKLPYSNSGAAAIGRSLAMAKTYSAQLVRHREHVWHDDGHGNCRVKGARSVRAARRKFASVRPPRGAALNGDIAPRVAYYRRIPYTLFYCGSVRLIRLSARDNLLNVLVNWRRRLARKALAARDCLPITYANLSWQRLVHKVGSVHERRYCRRPGTSHRIREIPATRASAFRCLSPARNIMSLQLDLTAQVYCHYSHRWFCRSIRTNVNVSLERKRSLFHTFSSGC